MIFSSPDRVTFQAVEELVSTKAQERRSLDYKEQLPGTSDSDKKDFLADVSSFANASGGLIVYGVTDLRVEGKPTGIPGELIGIEAADALAAKERLANLVNSGIEPRLTADIRGLESPSGRVVLTIWIPASIRAPHLVQFSGSTRFYSRTSHGKYQLDHTEIREAFLRSLGSASRLSAFRNDRLAKIISEEVSYGVHSPTLIVHGLGLESFLRQSRLSVATLRRDSDRLIPPNITPSPRYNLDGLLITCGYLHNKPLIVQVFRDGTVEAIIPLETPNHDALYTGELLELDIVKAVERIIDFHRACALTPPIVIFIALAHMTGVKLTYRGGIVSRYAFERDSVLLDEVVLEHVDEFSPQLLRGQLDTLWQAVGLEGSMHFYANGAWALSDSNAR